MRDAERRQLPIGDRALDDRRVHAELRERLDIGLHRAREAPDLRSQPRAFPILSTLGAPALAQPVQLASLEVVTHSSSFTGLPQYVFLP